MTRAAAASERRQWAAEPSISIANQEGHETWVQSFRGHDINTALQEDFDLPPAHPVGAWQRRFGRHQVLRPQSLLLEDRFRGQSALPYSDRQVRVVMEDQEVANRKAMSGEIHYASFHLILENYPLHRESESKGDYRTVLMVNCFQPAGDAKLRQRTLPRRAAG